MRWKLINVMNKLGTWIQELFEIYGGISDNTKSDSAKIDGVCHSMIILYYFFFGIVCAPTIITGSLLLSFNRYILGGIFLTPFIYSCLMLIATFLLFIVNKIIFAGMEDNVND